MKKLLTLAPVRFGISRLAFCLAPLLAYALVAWRRFRAPRGFDVFATASPVSPIAKGLTTIAWGSAPGGSAIASAPSGALVTSISITPVNQGPLTDIENPDGSCVASVLMNDGFTAEVEAVYDVSLTYPAAGDSATLTLPTKGSGANYPNLSAADVTHHIFPILIESNPVKFERKKEAMITFRVSHRPGRDGAPT